MTQSKKRPWLESSDRLDMAMRLLSQVGAVLGFGLMIFGFAVMVLEGGMMAVPGPSTLPMARLLDPSHSPLGLTAMSAGIVVLALLPVVRVVLALGLYVSQRDQLNSGVSLAVLLELILSTQLGGK